MSNYLLWTPNVQPLLILMTYLPGCLGTSAGLFFGVIKYLLLCCAVLCCVRHGLLCLLAHCWTWTNQIAKGVSSSFQGERPFHVWRRLELRNGRLRHRKTKKGKKGEEDG